MSAIAPGAGSRLGIPRGSLRTETIAPHQDPRWQRFVEQSSSGGIFHHVEWLRLLQDQYGYPLRAHCVTTGDGELVAGLPFALVRSRLTGTRLVAVPFSDTCEPVLGGGADTQALDLLLDSIRSEHDASGTRVEVRAEIGGLRRTELFYQHELDLESGVDVVRQGFNKNVSRGIARAQRRAVEVHRETGPAALGTFYNLHVRTRRRQGVPTQPKRFIQRFARLFERGLGFVLVARTSGQPIAAAVFLSFNGVLTYKYGASSVAHLDKRPNHAIFSEAVRWACGHGYRTLDFGRTEVDNEGLRAFKRSWGARERELGYTGLPETAPSANRSGVPRIVKTIVSRTPPLTGRLIGTAFYRHFG